MRNLGGLFLLVALLTACSDASGSDVTLDTYDCDDLAGEVATIDSNDGPRLIKVRDVKVVQDNTDDYEVPRRGEELLLSCDGTGVFDSARNGPVTLRLTVDSDGETFVSWRAN